MNIDQLRKICLGFPSVTEQIQWEDDLVFKVSGKMFAVARLEPAHLWLSLKADPEAFPELIERPGIIPAPYLARAKWVAIETPETLTAAEVSALLRKSYNLVCAKLPRAVRERLNSKCVTRKSTGRRGSRSKQRRRSR
jgi:predicted DNA-binding protein (MmcQ/YjbR family)